MFVKKEKNVMVIRNGHKCPPEYYEAENPHKFLRIVYFTMRPNHSCLRPTQPQGCTMLSSHNHSLPPQQTMRVSLLVMLLFLRDQETKATSKNPLTLGYSLKSVTF